MSRKKKRATQDMEAMDGVRNQQGVQRASFFGTYLGAHEDHPAPAGGVFLTATVDGVPKRHTVTYVVLGTPGAQVTYGAVGGHERR